MVLAGVVMLGSIWLGKHGSGSIFRQMWVAAVVVLILSFFADLAPTVAGPFALIVALSVGLTKGGLLSWLGSLGSSRTTAGGKP